MKWRSWDGEISIPSCRHTPYHLLKIKSAALLFNIKSAELFEFWNANIEVYSPFKHFSIQFKCRYGRKMCKCEGVTKYKCLEWFTFVCNIFSEFREDHDIYKEEEKLIGKLKLWWKSSSSQTKKRQETLEVKTKTKRNKKPKKATNWWTF